MKNNSTIWEDFYDLNFCEDEKGILSSMPRKFKHPNPSDINKNDKLEIFKILAK